MGGLGVHLTTEEAAARLRLSISTMKAWRASGSGPAYIKFGRKVLYPIAEMEKFEASCLQIAIHVKACEEAR